MINPEPRVALSPDDQLNDIGKRILILLESPQMSRWASINAIRYAHGHDLGFFHDVHSQRKGFKKRVRLAKWSCPIRPLQREHTLRRRLAQQLRCPQNTVLRIEQGERRIDFMEFWRICTACGAGFEDEVLEFGRAWKNFESSQGKEEGKLGEGRGNSLKGREPPRASACEGARSRGRVKGRAANEAACSCRRLGKATSLPLDDEERQSFLDQSGIALAETGGCQTLGLKEKSFGQSHDQGYGLTLLAHDFLFPDQPGYRFLNSRAAILRAGPGGESSWQISISRRKSRAVRVTLGA